MSKLNIKLSVDSDFKQEWKILGQFIIPDEMMMNFTNKFWTNIASRTSIKGYRLGKAPIESIINSYQPEFFEEEFGNYFLGVNREEMFALLHDYIDSINKSYVAGKILQGANAKTNKLEFYFLVDFTDSIDLDELKLTMPIVTDVEIEKRIGAYNIRKTKWMLGFLGDNNLYAESNEPIEVGDKVYIHFSMFSKDSNGKKLMLDEPKEGYTIVGSNGFIPEIDECLVGQKISKSKKQLEFRYSESSPSIYAGMPATYEYKISKIQKAKYYSLEELFASKKTKKIDGYSDLQSLEKAFEKDHNEFAEETKAMLEMEKIARDIIAKVPNFDFSDASVLDVLSNFEKNSPKEKTKFKNAQLSVSTDFGKFVGDKTQDYTDQIRNVNGDISKLEFVLSCLYHKNSRLIFDILGGIDQDQDEILQELVAEAELSGKDFDPRDLSFQASAIVDGQNRYRTLEWIHKIIETKGTFNLKKTKLYAPRHAKK